MSTNRKHCVIGASGFIGSHLYEFLQKQNEDVIGTGYPREAAHQGDLYYFDLSRTDISSLPLLGDQRTYLYFCAHQGTIEECAAKTKETRAVNVDSTIRMLEQVAEHNFIPVYFSTSAVFAGKRPDYTENDVPDPATEYGRQKAEVEQYIMNNFSRYLIMRLTKVYGTEADDNSLFTSWVNSWLSGRTVLAVPDSQIAPIHVTDVVSIVHRLLLQESYGLYHLSGPTTDSFMGFAQRLARYFPGVAASIEERSIHNLGLQEQQPSFRSLQTKKIEQTLHPLPLLTFDEACVKLTHVYRHAPAV